MYNVAYKLFEPTLILPGVLLAAVFPMLSQAAHASTPHNLRVMVGQTHLALLAFGGLATLGLALLATPLLSLLYGAQYLSSAPVLVALAFACVPMYLNYGLTHTLIAIDKPRLYALFTLASLFVNLAANLALIPILGVRGAAFATVGTEVVLLALCGGAVLHHLWQTRAAQPVGLAFASGRAGKRTDRPGTPSMSRVLYGALLLALAFGPFEAGYPPLGRFLWTTFTNLEGVLFLLGAVFLLPFSPALPHGTGWYTCPYAGRSSRSWRRRLFLLSSPSTRP